MYYWLDSKCILTGPKGLFTHQVFLIHQWCFGNNPNLRVSLPRFYTIVSLHPLTSRGLSDPPGWWLGISWDGGLFSGWKKNRKGVVNFYPWAPTKKHRNTRKLYGNYRLLLEFLKMIRYSIMTRALEHWRTSFIIMYIIVAPSFRGLLSGTRNPIHLAIPWSFSAFFRWNPPVLGGSSQDLYVVRITPIYKPFSWYFHGHLEGQQA